MLEPKQTGAQPAAPPPMLRVYGALIPCQVRGQGRSPRQVQAEIGCAGGHGGPERPSPRGWCIFSAGEASESQAEGAVCGEKSQGDRKTGEGGKAGELAVMWLVQGPTRKGPAEHKKTPGLLSGHRVHGAPQRGATGLRQDPQCSRVGSVAGEVKPVM